MRFLLVVTMVGACLLMLFTSRSRLNENVETSEDIFHKQRQMIWNESSSFSSSSSSLVITQVNGCRKCEL